MVDRPRKVVGAKGPARCDGAKIRRRRDRCRIRKMRSLSRRIYWCRGGPDHHGACRYFSSIDRAGPYQKQPRSRVAAVVFMRSWSASYTGLPIGNKGSSGEACRRLPTEQDRKAPREESSGKICSLGAKATEGWFTHTVMIRLICCLPGQKASFWDVLRMRQSEVFLFEQRRRNYFYMQTG